MSEERILEQFLKEIELFAGIKISLDKKSLIQNRLRKRAQETGHSKIEDYLALCLNKKDEIELCAQLLATHKTEWFREFVHYEFLARKFKSKQMDQVKVWSAACSSGEELYSTLFLLLKLGYAPDQFRLLGTDLSQIILKKAISLPENDEFKKELQKLSSKTTDPYLHEKVKLALQSSVKFRQFNLIQDRLPNDLKFDVIFVRNVLIYFDESTIKNLIEVFIKQLTPGGLIITGLSEPLKTHSKLKPVGPSIYELI